MVQPRPELVIERLRQNGIGARRLQHDPEHAAAGETAGQVLIERVCHRENVDRLKPGRELGLIRGTHNTDQGRQQNGWKLHTRPDKLMRLPGQALQHFTEEVRMAERTFLWVSKCIARLRDLLRDLDGLDRAAMLRKFKERCRKT